MMCGEEKLEASVRAIEEKQINERLGIDNSK
jgi:hypothetical protein